VRTWEGGTLTDPDSGAPEVDRYTRVRGSASHEAGWDTTLERFIGWGLPQVTTYNGEQRKLYLQTVMPMVFREQTRGWTGIFGAVPRHLQIRDPGRRAAEFLLSLDAYERARRREKLRAEETSTSREPLERAPGPCRPAKSSPPASSSEAMMSSVFAARFIRASNFARDDRRVRPDEARRQSW
jgi:hypothetical protein